jgi:phage shock protein E
MFKNPVLEKIQSGAQIIDVRTSDEFMDDHYPRARNIPVSELQGRMGEIGPKDGPIVVYCASGARSALAAKLLAAAGFTDVLNAGGLEDMPQ